MDRFEKVYSQGVLDVVEIWIDKETGVNYMFHRSGYSGGLTPLLNRDGTPIIWEKQEQKTGGDQ
ncbi:MAG: xylan 1,4-beta-xylosidase [Oscillospiraceae bacterium]|nr:xylan 1,4-beta-xylosidase [Oscillospiraceae bacterium]